MESLEVIRTRQRYTRKMVADHVGITYSAYYRIEKGMNGATMAHAVKIADLLGITLDELNASYKG